MGISVTELRPGFAAAIGGVDMRKPAQPEDVAVLRDAIDRFAVLVFPDQQVDDAQQAEFSRNFGELARSTEYAKPGSRRLSTEMTDASNIATDGTVRSPDDRALMNNYGSRRWHTDGSYKPVRGGYSFLSCRAVPPIGGETQFADMRAAYDALSDEMRARIEDLSLQHDIMHSRAAVGFSGFSEQERAAHPPVQHRLVQRNPRTGRKSLYLSSHASHVVGVPIYESIDLLYELTEIATQPDFVYTHRWKLYDIVMWDNRVTMHRGRRHSPATAPRDMRRTTTLDAPIAA
jgi:alpha-ketoglutarate-dependent 2,4-dichlorophenoxyacetate dioxygenase